MVLFGFTKLAEPEFIEGIISNKTRENIINFSGNKINGSLAIGTNLSLSFCLKDILCELKQL